MHTNFVLVVVIGIFLTSQTEGIRLDTIQNGGSQSGDGILDIDNGSGVGPTFTDDEDLGDESSGEGSGSGLAPTKIPHDLSTILPTTTRSLTACEQLRLSAENITTDVYRPKCTVTGEYEPLQCHRRMYNKECWCVDRFGDEVTGSKMMQPNVPDCITGKGLKPCVFQLLKKKQGLLGVYHPRCTIDGEFEKIQCHGSACWCVDVNGLERRETRVFQPEVPNCIETTKATMPSSTTTSPKTENPTPEPVPLTEKPEVKEKSDNKDIHKYTPNIGEDEKNEDRNIIIPGINGVAKPVDPNMNNRHDIDKEETDQGRAESQESSPIVYIMARPGLLAAVIGGAVVALLLTILLVMFIVYRMRKKDEGSYPLDEQKYTNYSYMKAPDKEFYA
ncbi:probable syndecan [Saccostrea echinata]|uniref:probable syndecan n=1 Tax=Saccostrea echinata TaxID=191078 RepID=UPI002A83E2CF|nr:probable syndecan [Saccostrea echinata]